MLRRALSVACICLFLAGSAAPALASSVASLNVYGYPMDIGPGGTGLAGVPGEAYTLTTPGLGLDGLTSTYGVLIGSSVSTSPNNQYAGYLGSDMSGIQLGVSFGWPTATHDAATAAYSQNMAYEASLNTIGIAFPGIGVGSLGMSYPTLTNTKTDIKYSESVQYVLSTESDTLPLTGWLSPLGLGLGYGSVGITGGSGIVSSGMSGAFYYPTQ